MSTTTTYLDVLWPELYAGLDAHGRDSVVWALVVRRAHGHAVTRDVVVELTDRARCLAGRRVAVA